MSFKDDIKGQSTNLYPIVTIEPPNTYSGGNQWLDDLENCIFLSTNAVSLNHIHEQYYIDVNSANLGKLQNIAFKPILLNIPSIKESIDIESKKFKISNVNLDISNFEYNGERFSDILSNTSLINWKVSVQFVSPTAKHFSTIFPLSDGEHSGWKGRSMYDVYAGDIENFSASFQSLIPTQQHKMTHMAYQGIIRRISHDDEKVRVELEDSTEEKTHKNLPKLTAPPSDYLPEKYANKPIPMVYGHVDRSPLLPYYSYSEDVGDDSDEVESILEYRLKIDTEQYHEIVEEIVNIGNSEFTKSGLFIKEADAYLNLHKTNAALGYPTGVENFRYEDTSIVLDTDDVSYSEDASETSSNDFSEGRLRVHQIRRFNKVSWEESGVEVQTSANGGLIQGELQATSAGIGRITGTIDTDTYQSGSWAAGSNDDATRDWNAGHFKCVLEPISIPNSMAKDEDGNIEPPVTRVLVDVVHFNFRNESNTPSGQTQNTEGPHPDLSSKLYTKWGVWVGGVPFDHTESGGQSEDNYYTNSNSVDNINGDESIDEILLDAFTSLTSYDNIKIGIPKHNYLVSSLGAATTFGDNDDVIFNVDTTINDAFVVQTFLLDGVTDKDYFVNVKGRINTFTDHHIDTSEFLIENPIDIIYDLVRKELGYDAIDEKSYQEARTEHNNWKFGFTIDKKIDSKKLIEDISKSTKCFPYFGNNGKFKFNTIKSNYSVDDYIDATEIKVPEVISYSFKKTKPEQIYKKVDVQYNKDYAEGSLTKRTKPYITGNVSGEAVSEWSESYYGIEALEDSYLEFESPYIREEDTALALRNFLTDQYRNDHLVFNLKLPLKYIGLEIGDLVKFRELFNGIEAYGIDYRIIQTPNNEDEAQEYFPLFMVTSTKKNLDSVEIECMQLHFLRNDYLNIPFLSSDWSNDSEEFGHFYFPDSPPIVPIEPVTASISFAVNSAPQTITVDSNGWDGQINNNNYIDVQLPTATGTIQLTNGTIIPLDYTAHYGGLPMTSDSLTVRLYDNQETHEIIYRTIQPDDLAAQAIYVEQTATHTITLQEGNNAPTITIEPKNNALLDESIFTESVPVIIVPQMSVNFFDEFINNDSRGLSINAHDVEEGDLTYIINYRVDEDESEHGYAVGDYITFIDCSETNTLETMTRIYPSVRDSGVGGSAHLWGETISDIQGFAVHIVSPEEYDELVGGYGDVNLDGVVNVLDVVQTVNFILHNIDFTQEQQNAADMNNDGDVNVLDVVTMVNFILDS